MAERFSLLYSPRDVQWDVDCALLKWFVADGKKMEDIKAETILRCGNNLILTLGSLVQGKILQLLERGDLDETALWRHLAAWWAIHHFSYLTPHRFLLEVPLGP